MVKVKKGLQTFGLPRIIIIAFFILLIITAGVSGIGIPGLIGDVLRRWSMFGILVLAMVPAIQSGIGPNFGIAMGVVGGLLGSLISIELRFYGFFDSFNGPGGELTVLSQFMGALVALLLALVFGSIFGLLYGLLLNRVKGSEMTVATYVGFSIIALFNIIWLVLPFRSGTSIWPLGGEGLRNTINLEGDFAYVFSNFLSFRVAGVTVPTGMLLLFFLACFCVWLFCRSRTGIMMRAAGSNPTYARAAGINVDKMRLMGTMLSTALGAVGIVCYAQTFGFLQLYNAPLYMGFHAVAAVLIGGATIRGARIAHVILGCFLYQGILAIALPVANQVLPEGDLSEVFRIIISNGIILYALSKAKGGDK